MAFITSYKRQRGNSKGVTMPFFNARVFIGTLLFLAFIVMLVTSVLLYSQQHDAVIALIHTLIGAAMILVVVWHLFKNSKVDSFTYKHDHDKTGNSMMYQETYTIDSDGSADVFCVNWSKKLEQEENRIDELGVSISLKEFDVFVQSVFN